MSLNNKNSLELYDDIIDEILSKNPGISDAHAALEAQAELTKRLKLNRIAKQEKQIKFLYWAIFIYASHAILMTILGIQNLFQVTWLGVFQILVASLHTYLFFRDTCKIKKLKSDLVKQYLL